MLDHAPRPGGAWRFRWPSLTYGKVHGMHALPGMELTGADPDRPSSEVIGAYFAAYEDRFGLQGPPARGGERTYREEAAVGCWWRRPRERTRRGR